MKTSAPEPKSALWHQTWVRVVLYLLCAYVGLAVMLMFLENRLLFHPTTVGQSWIDPPAAPSGRTRPMPTITDVTLTAKDGTKIHAWWCTSKDAKGAMLYCHGNAGNLSHRGVSIIKLHDILGVSVLIVDYPGYGKSAGSPSEAGCYAAAEAGYDWIIGEQKIPAQKVLLYGASLGGGVITEVACKRDHRALILVKTFTSVPDVASEMFWWLPVPTRVLVRNRFESKNKLKSCNRPIFIGHGTTDEIIPYSHGERLFASANEPRQFHTMHGAGHNDPLPAEFFAELQAFLAKHAAE